VSNRGGDPLLTEKREKAMIFQYMRNTVSGNGKNSDRMKKYISGSRSFSIGKVLE
jgi:hypothetical protein